MLNSKDATLPPGLLAITCPPSTDGFDGLPVEALEIDECRWPVWTGADGRTRFCAEPVSQSPGGKPRPYCEAHASRAFTGRLAGAAFRLILRGDAPLKFPGRSA